MRFLLLILLICSARADWPTLKGNNQRNGYVPGNLAESHRLNWALEFEGERIGTAIEPIVAQGRVFISTHHGSLYAINSMTGTPAWRFRFPAPLLHSPAASGNMVVAAAADGMAAALDIRTGNTLWQRRISPHGFSASPMVQGGKVYLGCRGGNFYALNLNTGDVIWELSLGAPIRQTAALSGDQIFVGSEDLRMHCLNAKTGALIWSSGQLHGQTFRDYYPVVLSDGIFSVRPNPILTMSHRISRDRTLLAQNAGVDDSSWKTVDAWIKNPASKGTPELWAKENKTIIGYLTTNPEAQSCYLLDAQTGQLKPPVPILWASGCQAAGAPLALLPDGSFLIFYRSAYGNWNHGVAPLVALGSYNYSSNQVTPFIHANGQQPPWNTFWGTADESQNFTVVGRTILIAHQGTLSSFDLESRQLRAIAGNRDTYGGYKNPEWARNEWHGPARGSAVHSDGRIYWITGSRLLALAAGPKTPNPPPLRIANFPAKNTKAEGLSFNKENLSNKLAAAVLELVSTNWSPLFVDPGLAGRDFSFDEISDLLEAAALALPHLEPSLQAKLTAYVTKSPITLNSGKPREWFNVPAEYRTRDGRDKPPHPFGNLFALHQFAIAAKDEKLLDLTAIKKDFENFATWSLEEKGGLYANRYIASLFALSEIAREQDPHLAKHALQLADLNFDRLCDWWKRAAEGTLREFNSSSELDPYIGRGGGISFAIAPHRHKIAPFNDLTPDLAARLLKQNKTAVQQVWKIFDQLYATWHLVGEERQVHTGENYVDPPDLAWNAFKAYAWLAKARDVDSKIDIPAGRADLYYISKLSLALNIKAQARQP